MGLPSAPGRGVTPDTNPVAEDLGPEIGKAARYLMDIRSYNVGAG